MLFKQIFKHLRRTVSLIQNCKGNGFRTMFLETLMNKHIICAHVCWVFSFTFVMSTLNVIIQICHFSIQVQVVLDLKYTRDLFGEFLSYRHLELVSLPPVLLYQSLFCMVHVYIYNDSILTEIYWQECGDSEYSILIRNSLF